MTTARFIVGDSLTVLRGMPDASVDLVVTSPPFLALRSYLPPDHPDKALEIGGEATPGEFIDALLDIVAECRRVLAPHGSLCLELGDTYSGSGGAGGDYNDGGLRDGQQRFDGSARANRGGMGGDGWPLAKSLCLIPELFRFALVYGCNPLTGRTLKTWRVRNVVRWCRPNPPVGALGDKFRPATSDIAVACMSKARYFDLDAVRTQHKADPATYSGNGYTKGNPSGEGENKHMPGNPAGAPPLDWWKVNTRGYTGSHYATYPPELIDRLVQSMCPPKVCTTCGEPSRRLIDIDYSEAPDRPLRDDEVRRYGSIDGKRHNDHRATVHTTTGWTDCGHNTWRRGIVLDPFAGTGTTLAVATGHGHDAIGIDLDERNADLALERVGFFLTVQRSEPVEVSTSADSDPAHSCTAPTGYAVDTPDISNWPEVTA